MKDQIEKNYPTLCEAYQNEVQEHLNEYKKTGNCENLKEIKAFDWNWQLDELLSRAEQLEEK